MGNLIPGFSTGPCSVNYALAAMILAAAEIANPDYIAETMASIPHIPASTRNPGFLAMNLTKILGYTNLFGTIANLLVLVIFFFTQGMAACGYHSASECASKSREGCVPTNSDLTTTTPSKLIFRMARSGL
jgi:hypothetical protein